MSEEETKYQTEEPQGVAPTLEMMEGAKDALLTYVMYYYQAARMAGNSVDVSKDMTANYILELYDKYAKVSAITFKPERMRNPHALLQEIEEDLKALGGIKGKVILNKLQDFKSFIDKGE